ncbi:putative quinol monooxygenase [Mycolicibacterium sp. jd]|uniref:Antibiotic biosynthesis monooxygenase n=2 Tax=Mycobacteriaceae TaxID=1762 RepID=A0A1Y0CGZ7_9MYCO|nr:MULTISPECIES: antibiotic biosynthesis monooxygenase [Mycobacteriaceae]ART74553.1 antibiotic biosynthesis monooxygenase [Mycobacterium dioxanotrophicus]MDN4521837.1 antibiotic biosynthesis monooxygenase [Mycolicibacterium austroafricanum]UJL30586.1 antibiotic biosynthesis monooxygenase [Mycolicibacterium vanbaalenii]WND56308.1 antibiotic biosynthesis monooxygenase [Mycolicibacterium vanbaalenii]
MPIRVGLLVTIEAKPTKGDEVAAFLESAQQLVEQEPATVTWYAIRLGPTSFGIFDTFADDEGRQAHLSGAVAEALGKATPDLLAAAPDIRAVDVLATTRH